MSTETIAAPVTITQAPSVILTSSGTSASASTAPVTFVAATPTRHATVATA